MDDKNSSPSKPPEAIPKVPSEGHSESEQKPRPVREMSRVGSRELFAVHWTKAQPSLTAFLIASTPQFSDAEDLLQEVAAEIAQRFDDYDSSRPFLPWALWVAKIKVADFYRKKERRPVKFIGDSIEALSQACDRIQTIVSEEKWALEKCLTTLANRSRSLLHFRYYDDLTTEEIASKVGMKSGAVRTALTRIRTYLIDCMRSTLNEAASSHER
ncbi:sigma-70 family RNA polymerase sigma factor [Planctopirus hydrillae]|nr:sigma-70 family RNA polymerase sigma factor [Planctopirus hydrillae]